MSLTPEQKLLRYALLNWSPWSWGACAICGKAHSAGHSPDCGWVEWEKETSLILGQAKGGSD